MYKTSITDLELSAAPLTNGCHNDNIIQLGPLRSQSLFQFIRSLMHIWYTMYTFSCNSFHMLKSTGFISGKFGDHS